MGIIDKMVYIGEIDSEIIYLENKCIIDRICQFDYDKEQYFIRSYVLLPVPHPEHGDRCYINTYFAKSLWDDPDFDSLHILKSLCEEQSNLVMNDYVE